MRALLHPAHRPVMPRLEPALEVEPSGIGSVGAREAAGARSRAAPLRPLLLPQAFRRYPRAGLYTALRIFRRNFSASTGSASTALDTLGRRSHRSRQRIRRHPSGRRRQSRRARRDRSTACSAPMAPARRRPCACCIGIIDPSSGTRRLLGRERPLEAAAEIGYLPEERGLYPAMHAREAIAFMGALRGLPLAEGRRRADALLAEHGLGDWAKKSIRSLVQGHGADRSAARHHRPQAPADRPRRAVRRPRCDQPGHGWRS